MLKRYVIMCSGVMVSAYSNKNDALTELRKALKNGTNVYLLDMKTNEEFYG